HDQPIKTAQDGARYFGIEPGQTASTLIVKTDNQFYVVICSGQRGRVNFAEIPALQGSGTVQLASADEVKQATGCAVGSVPLAGHSLPCIVDKLLFRYPYVYGGTGDPLATLKIPPAALEQVNHVVSFFE
ncbi:YbaK/EbsC family protein, partial [Microbacteriaceae bacterium K1510]|nr:YbaK/EbsC family protein [Microbacteriaceae bacterium K1510]